MTDTTISHDDLCRLSRSFNENANLAITQDYRINEWLKVQIATALAPQPPSPHLDRGQLSKRPVAFRVANPSTGGWTIFGADEEDEAWARGNEIGCEYQGLYVRSPAESGEAATTEQDMGRYMTPEEIAAETKMNIRKPTPSEGEIEALIERLQVFAGHPLFAEVIAALRRHAAAGEAKP